MASQQQFEEPKMPEILSISFWPFRLRAENPGKNTYLLIAELVIAVWCLSLMFLLVVITLRTG